jgi:hypothetical protein
MPTTTPNYGWSVPVSTDFVKNGASDIESLGDDVDAAMYTLENDRTTSNGFLRTAGRTLSVNENVEGGIVSNTFASFARDSNIPVFINRITGTTSAACIQFYRNGTAAGFINASTTAAPTLVAPSDYRLKENIEPLTDAADRIKSANVYSYNFIADDDKETRYGFLAHEVSDLMNDLVIGDKDGVDENGDPVYQHIQETRLIPVLVAALKDALLRIEALEESAAPKKSTKTTK